MIFFGLFDCVRVCVRFRLFINFKLNCTQIERNRDERRKKATTTSTTKQIDWRCWSFLGFCFIYLLLTRCHARIHTRHGHCTTKKVFYFSSAEKSSCEKISILVVWYLCYVLAYMYNIYMCNVVIFICSRCPVHTTNSFVRLLWLVIGFALVRFVCVRR